MSPIFNESSLAQQPGSLIWTFGVDNRPLQKDLGRTLGLFESLTSKITKLDVFAGLGISFALVSAKIAKDSLKLASDLETALKEVETISKSVQDNFGGVLEQLITLATEVPDGGGILSMTAARISSIPIPLFAEQRKTSESSTSISSII